MRWQPAAVAIGAVMFFFVVFPVAWMAEQHKHLYCFGGRA
jgi:hypothetical protein